MRYGFTTGSCAAAAAKAAAYMLLSGRKKNSITIQTPKGILYNPDIKDIKIEENGVSCAVIKDGGDDPDVTTGALVYAKVEYNKETSKIIIDGGIGVGRVTRPGLDQPVGNAAINSVPRSMIEKEVKEVCELFDYQGGLSIVIYIPEGERIASKTFNPRLGIVGGISVLGTTGIVEPMSSQAIIDTIHVELRQKRAEGAETAAVSPGNYGLDFLKRTYGYDLNTSVKCSNFIGITIDMVKELGFKKMIITGHIGKLIKVSGGIMNTHSHEGDCRMELLAAAAVRTGTDIETVRKILDCISTEDACHILKERGFLEGVMKYVVEKIYEYMSYRAGDGLKIECMVYSNDFGLLGRTEGAEEMLRELSQPKSQTING